MYVSSSMVFERATEFPTTEEHLADCLAPRSAYGFSKLAGEVYTRAAHDEHGLRYTICRPFNAYGPGELPDADEPGIAHAVPDLIHKALTGRRPLEIFGSGEQTRTITHVDDIADGIVTAMASPAGENEDFNISASQELTVAELAALIWEACGNDPGRVRAAAPARASRSTCSGAGRRSRRPGGCSAGRRGSTCATGLAQTVEWLRDQAQNDSAQPLKLNVQPRVSSSANISAGVDAALGRMGAGRASARHARTAGRTPPPAPRSRRPTRRGRNGAG